MPTFKALTGLNYLDKRVEAGETVSDLPKSSVTWLLDRGHIQPVEAKPVKKSPAKKKEG